MEKEKIYSFWERFNQTLNKCMSAENNLKKSKNSEYFLLIQSKYFHTDNWKISLENMEDKIIGLQFVLVSARPTHPSHNDGSDQDEPQKQPLEVFCRKSALRNFAKLTVKHLYQSLFFKKLLKGTLVQVFYSEFFEISKNTIFTKHIWATASGTRNPT